ncbi:hypothetical protein [Aeromicrobium sp.]|uniref:hypothetical protein n=1 Tax=Aeromicrobium sp. TaxID=1871063 RepID=UPI0035126659
MSDLPPPPPTPPTPPTPPAGGGLPPTPPPPPPPPGAPFGGPDGPPPAKRSKLPLVIAAAVAAVLVVAGGVFVAVRLLGGGGPDDAADKLLASIDQTEPDYAEQCALLSPKLRKAQLEAARVKSCDGWVKAQEKQLAESKDQKISRDSACTLTFADFSDVVDFSYTITTVKEDGDKASVGYTTTTRFTGDDKTAKACLNGDKKTQTTKGTLAMRKYDGEWLLDELPR